MCIKKICLLFTIFTVTTVLCTQDQKKDEFYQRYIQVMNKTTNHSNDDKIPGVISLDTKPLDTTDVVTFNNLTARTTKLPEMTMGSKFKKKISQLKQINDDKKSIDLINSSANTSTTPTNETKFLKISNIYIHDNNTNDNNNNNNSNNNIYSVENLDKPITMTTIIDDDNNNKTSPSIANLNSIEKVLNPSTIKTFESNFSRARALDIPSSPSEPTNSLNANLTDLSDVSMDEEDKQVEGGEYIAAHHNESHIKILPIIFTSEPKCIEPNNKTYLLGETIVRGCTEKCICGYNGTAENCQPICKSPLVRAIGKSQDPFCHKQQIDNNDCCAILICSSVNYDHKSVESTETCNFIGNDNENKTITIGEHIEDGCSRICTCQVGGVLNCKPRCPLVADNDNNNNNNYDDDDDDDKSHKANFKMNNYDRCVKLKDPRDPCCTITYCDVSIGEHDELISSIDDTVATTTKTINDFNDGILNDTNLINDQVKVLNSTAIKILLSQQVLNNNKTIVEISKNNHTWKQQIFNKEGIISNLEPSSIYYIRIKTDGKNNNNNDNKTISTVDGIVALPATEIKINKNKSNNGSIIKMNNEDTCSHRGNLYKIGTEWYDECIYFCVCEKGAKTECVTIECPTDFGLDVLDPHCIDWETVPLNFVPKAPQCCPEEVRCRNNGSCIYQNITYDNWSEIPNNITGCDKRCYCEMGKVSCQPACPPIPALPPDTLSCVSNQAILSKLPDDECCLHWTCSNENNNNYHTSISGMPAPSSGHIYPSLGFPIHSDVTAATEYLGQVSEQSSLNDNNDDEIIIKSLDAIDDSTIRILFTVPTVLVGLYGRVELRYTKEKINLDPSKWKSQVFIPPNDLIATPQLEFELDGLEPSTEYKLKVTVNLGNGQAFKNNPTSKIYSIKTLERYKDRHQILTTITTTTTTPTPTPTTTEVSLPPQIFIDAGLKVTEKNFSWIKVEWKKFTEYEIQFIDGIQLRYKEYDSKVYTTTPLIHRAVTSWVIEDLKPATTYQIGISIIPFPGQTTELYSEKTIQITTAIELDPYSFDVKVEIKTVKSQEVELSWSGVPYPEDKYVNIYRAIYQSDSGKGDTSTFKIAKRDSPAKTIISDLKPGTRYRLWLEIYLTNGKIKKSNVQDFITKPGVDLLHTASSDNIYHQPDKFNIVATAAAASIPSLQLEGNNNNNNKNNNNNYYGPLVIVAIVASLSILSTLILLMMLMKRRSSNKADISSSRKTTTSAAYDNPSYKVEIQQETMDL